MTNENYGNTENEKITGTVKHWKGTYGFVTPDDSKLSDCFIHCEQIEPWRDGYKELRVGQKVKFHSVKSEKKDKNGNPKYEARNLEIERDDENEVNKKFGRNK